MEYIKNGSVDALGVPVFKIMLTLLNMSSECTEFGLCDSVCLVVRKRGLIPKWKLLGKIFEPWAWFGCFAFFMLTGISWYLMQKFNQLISQRPVSFFLIFL